MSKLIVTLLSNLIMLFTLSLLVQTSLSQSSAISESEEERSFYLNQPVLHPEALSGIWETPIGNGGAVGICLRLATKLPDDSRIPWTPQAWQHLEVGPKGRAADPPLEPQRGRIFVFISDLL